ncbi:MAG TPA: hypothetical protein VLJ58_20720 [Ramlibacter sp.]|nr:hypothetical protein [Ramlibacter sp.]
MDHFLGSRGKPPNAAAPVAPQGAAASRRGKPGAEAARYGVLRRLAPALKHDMVVHLQAVAMMAEVLNARLDRGSPSPADFQKNISDINRLAREAVAGCLKVATWISPSEDVGVPLAQGVNECVGLLQNSFNFRGFTIVSEVPDSGFEVSLVTLRNLLAASLVAVADAAPAPGLVQVTAEMSPGHALLSVRCTPGEVVRDEPSPEVPYRQLDWADVQSLAQAEGVELFRGEGQIAMRIPRMVATTALQIAPL